MSTQPDKYSAEQAAKNHLKQQAKAERQRQIAKVKKKIKRNREPNPPRQKKWLPGRFDSLDDLDDLDIVAREKIMPPGEQDRRKALMAKAARAVEDEAQQEEAQVFDALRLRGIVIEIGSSVCRVEVGGRELLCYLRGSLSAHDTAFTNVVAVGDEVLVSDDALGGGVVEKVLPRRSALTRLDVFHGHLRQVIAANVDQLLIITAWREPHIWPELIDRYLIAAERNNLLPILCVNKIDLAEDRAVCQAMLEPYHRLNHQVLFTSARTGEGIEELRAALQGRSTVLAGLSGVGKSSLLTAMQPNLRLRTHDVSEHSGQGQHTTSQAVMLPLEGGGYVVDTPGIRELGLNGLHRRDLIGFYPDLSAVAGCRFSDCAHVYESDCAVKQAVENGLLPALRYETYCKIYEALAP